MLYSLSAPQRTPAHMSVFEDERSSLDRLVMLWLVLNLLNFSEEKSHQK